MCDYLAYYIGCKWTKLSDWFIRRFWGFFGVPQRLSSKESACSAGDSGVPDLIPGWGRSPKGGHSNPLQYSCLENPMDRKGWWAMVHRVAKGQTQLKCHHTCTHEEVPSHMHAWGFFSCCSFWNDLSSTILYLHFLLPFINTLRFVYDGQLRNSQNFCRPEELPTICWLPLWLGREYNKHIDASLRRKLFKSLEMVSPGEWGHCKVWAGGHLTWKGKEWGGRGTGRLFLGSSWNWLAGVWLAVCTSFQDLIKSLFWMHRIFCQNN